MVMFRLTWEEAMLEGTGFIPSWSRHITRMHGIHCDRFEVAVIQTTNEGKIVGLPPGQPIWYSVAKGYKGDKIYFEVSEHCGQFEVL